MTDDELSALRFDGFRVLDNDSANGNEIWTRLREWALSVVCWDGLLPMAVVWIPILAQLVLPNWPIVFALLFFLCPVTALSIRFVMGWLRLRRGKAFFWQFALFIVALSALFLFEMFILNDQLAKGPKIADPQVLAAMFLIYLAAMAVALFPFSLRYRPS